MGEEEIKDGTNSRMGLERTLPFLTFLLGRISSPKELSQPPATGATWRSFFKRTFPPSEVKSLPIRTKISFAARTKDSLSICTGRRAPCKYHRVPSPSLTHFDTPSPTVTSVFPIAEEQDALFFVLPGSSLRNLLIQTCRPILRRALAA